MTDCASTDALRAFAARVAELATTLETEGFPADGANRAYGVRHTLRQLVMAVQSEVEFGDPNRPRFHRYEQPWLQWGGPNPDNVYLRAAIAPAGTYRVSGNVRGVRAAIFSLVDGDMHLGKFGVFSERTLDDFEVGDDGTLEFLVTAGASEGNVMPAHPDARMLLIRQYQSDWERDAIATFHIERVDAVADDAGIDTVRALERAGEWAAQSLQFWRDYVDGRGDGRRRTSSARPRPHRGARRQSRTGRDGGTSRTATRSSSVATSPTPTTGAGPSTLGGGSIRVRSTNGRRVSITPRPTWTPTAGTASS